MSVYRELFCELSRDAFEIARAIGEQAVKRAQEREVVGTPVHAGLVGQILEMANESLLVEFLCARYGWNRFFVGRYACNQEAGVSARLECGHVVEYEPIDERTLYLNENPCLAFISALDNSVRNTPRCYCVRRASRSTGGMRGT